MYEKKNIEYSNLNAESQKLMERRHWLRLMAKSEMLPKAGMGAILSETEALIRIFLFDHPDRRKEQ